MNIPALPLQTGEDEEGQTFEIKIIFSAKGWASPPTLHNRAAQGLDVRHLPSPSPCGRGEVFSLDIPFYRTRPVPVTVTFRTFWFLMARYFLDFFRFILFGPSPAKTCVHSPDCTSKNGAYPPVGIIKGSVMCPLKSNFVLLGLRWDSN